MSFLSDKIYPLMPVSFQNVIISVFGYQWKRRRFGGIFERELEKFKSREIYTTEQWRDYQTTELRKVLIHAFETVPYYNSVYRNAGISVKEFKKCELEDMNKLPVLSKDELRKCGKSSLLSSKREQGGQFFSSSGSTGTPTVILFSNTMHQRWSAAFEARIRNWAGLSRFDSRGMIGGRRIVTEGISKGPFYRYNSIEKQIYFSAYHISSANSGDYAFALNKYKPVYMTGYAMSNYFLAGFLDEKKIAVPELKAVITSSEKLTSEMREMFLKVYACKTYDSYSGVEACGLISENEFGQLLISSDVGIMEILNEKGEPCKPGEIGEIYSTGFLNYDQPLIRYRIGDRVRLAEDQTTRCGRNMIVVDEIIGRSEDVVIGPDGRQIVRFHGLYIDIQGLVAGQLIQHGYEDFTIKLQVDNKFNKHESENLIRRRLISQIGNVKVKFEYPEKIPSGPNGKFKAVVSYLLQS